MIQTQIDKVSIKQISSNLSVLGKEEIMTTVSAQMGFLGGWNWKLDTVKAVTRAEMNRNEILNAG